MNLFNISRKRGLTVFFLLALLLSISWLLYFFQDYVFSLVNQLAIFIDKHVFLGVFIFIIVSVLAVILSPFSSLPLVPSAILAWGEMPTFLFLMAGWMIGAVAGYFLGYFTREALLEKFFSLKKIERYRNQISQDAQFLLVLIFRLAIPSEITAYTLGVIKYDFKKFVIISFISELPFALFVVYSGRAIQDRDFFLLIGIIIFTLIFISFFSLLLNKKFRQAKGEKGR